MGIAMSRTIIDTANRRIIRMLFLLNVDELRSEASLLAGRPEFQILNSNGTAPR